MSKLTIQFCKIVKGDWILDGTVGYGGARVYAKSDAVQNALKKLPSDWVVEDRPENLFVIQIPNVVENGLSVSEGWDRAFALARVFEKAGLRASIEAKYLNQKDEWGRYMASGHYIGDVHLDN